MGIFVLTQTMYSFFAILPDHSWRLYFVLGCHVVILTNCKLVISNNFILKILVASDIRLLELCKYHNDSSLCSLTTHIVTEIFFNFNNYQLIFEGKYFDQLIDVTEIFSIKTIFWRR